MIVKDADTADLHQWAINQHEVMTRAPEDLDHNFRIMKLCPPVELNGFADQ